MMNVQHVLTDPVSRKTQAVRVRCESNQLAISLEGYGECDAIPGQGSPVLLDLHNGCLSVVVFADINTADPTHRIDLKEAQEDRRGVVVAPVQLPKADTKNAGQQNTGDHNAGHQNAGNHNTGDWNTGSWNTGSWNTGRWNTGNGNAGSWNTGSWNIGSGNTGSLNTGDWNTGDYNTGDWNTGNGNAGFFCTESPSLMFFDKPTTITQGEAITLIPTVELCVGCVFVPTANMSDEEKVNTLATGGYLKEHKLTLQQAFPLAWKKMTKAQQNAWLQLPNFDAEKFLKCTGVDVRVKPKTAKVRLPDGSVAELEVVL